MPEEMKKNENAFNSFEQLQQQHEADFQENQSESIQTGIWSTLGTFRFIGVLVDLYVPKFVSFLAALAGGGDNGSTHNTEERGFVFGSGMGTGDNPSDENPKDTEEDN